MCVCPYVHTHGLALLACMSVCCAHLCVCGCACVCMLAQYNGRPKGAERNRMSRNSKVFFSFYYHTIAEGREREREEQR